MHDLRKTALEVAHLAACVELAGDGVLSQAAGFRNHAAQHVNDALQGRSDFVLLIFGSDLDIQIANGNFLHHGHDGILQVVGKFIERPRHETDLVASIHA